MFNSLWLHGLQYARLPCPLSDHGPLNRWCCLIISSSAGPFSFCLQSFPVPGSFPVTRLFTMSGQSIGASASASALSMNTEDWFPLRLTGLIPLLFKGLSRVFPGTTVWRHQLFGAQPYVQLSHAYMITGKNQSFDYINLCW